MFLLAKVKTIWFLDTVQTKITFIVLNLILFQTYMFETTTFFFFHTMKVNGVQCDFDPHLTIIQIKTIHSSKYPSSTQRNSHRFGTTWEWVNDTVFNFGWRVPLNKNNRWNGPIKWNGVSPCDPVMADQCQHIIIVPVYNSSASASLSAKPVACTFGRNDFLLMFIWEWGVNRFTATMHTTCTELESIHFYLPVVKITSLFQLLSTVRFIWFCI